MYLEHFHLTRSPFEEEPDPEIFFTGGERKAVFEALVVDILAGKPLIKFIGREGSGKTLICRLLVNRSLPDHDVVYLDNPIGSFDDLLRIVCLDLGMNPSGSHESVNFLHELYYLINQRREEGKKVLIIVDEAEKLFLATLERLVRTICDTEEATTLRIVLAGRPGLDVNLDQLSIYCANVGINAGHNLQPLDEIETGDYLHYRLEAAGLSGDQQEELFSDGAVSKIHASAQGNMRMINILAEEALQKSCTDKSFMVLLDHVDVEHEEDASSAALLNRVRKTVESTYASCMENRLLAGGGLGAFVLVIIIALLVGGGEEEPAVTLPQKEVRIAPQISSSPPPEKIAPTEAIPTEKPVPEIETAPPVEVTGESVGKPAASQLGPLVVQEEEQPPAVVEEPEQVVEPLDTAVGDPEEGAAEQAFEPKEEEMPVAQVVEPKEEEAPAVQVAELKEEEAPAAQVAELKEEEAPVVQVAELKEEEVPVVQVVGRKKEAVKAAGGEEPDRPEVEKPVIVTLGPEGKKRAVGEPKLDVQAPEIQPVKREVAKVISNGRDGDRLFRERRRASVSWLAEAYRGSYTIQLMTLTSNQAEANLKRMLVQDQYYEIQDKLYILRKKTTPPTLFVYYGIYQTMEKARNERNTMPVFLRKHHPYPLAIAHALKKTED